VSMEVYVVQADTSCFVHKTVHITRHPVQNNGAAEVDAMLVLIVCSATEDLSGCSRQMCLLCSLHLVSMDLPVWPLYTLPHSHGIRYTLGTFKPKLSSTDLSIYMVFFHGIWTILMLNLPRSLLICWNNFYGMESGYPSRFSVL
jgi:hypothetical protein